MNILTWLKRIVRPHRLPIKVEDVERALGYHFTNPSYLFKSLKHRSYSQAVDGTIRKSNERLEFLGDSVLNAVVSHYVFTNYPEFQEGDLTKLKSSFVNKRAAMIAGKRIGLDRFVLLNDSEESAGGRKRTSIIADAYEAVIGAIFLDGGYHAAEEFVFRSILNDPDRYLEGGIDNFKSRLLELAQAEHLGHPVYRTIDERGPDHAKIFTVTVSVHGKVIGTGSGRNKKTAQQMAAKEGITLLASNGDQQ